MKDPKEFPQNIEEKVRRLLKSRDDKAGFRYYAALIGGGGWLFVLPVIAGAYLGKFLDKNVQAGISWTLTLMILGIAVGAYNVWYVYFRKSGR